MFPNKIICYICYIPGSYNLFISLISYSSSICKNKIYPV